MQARARVGHAAVRRYDKGFRVLGSTQTVNARANTCTQSSDTDAAVYWLNGDKAADDYADFYDGSWDNPNRAWYESGSRVSGNVTGRTWTGTNNNGTTATALIWVFPSLHTDALPNPRHDRSTAERGQCDHHSTLNRALRPVPGVRGVGGERG